jgi:hypothetical protein
MPHLVARAVRGFGRCADRSPSRVASLDLDMRTTRASLASYHYHGLLADPRLRVRRVLDSRSHPGMLVSLRRQVTKDDSGSFEPHPVAGERLRLLPGDVTSEALG